ncbi:MAG: hypothetical protein KJO52_00165 [Maribacter sp.]|nr:hypothetical protein [Maribacter sp.]
MRKVILLFALFFYSIITANNVTDPTVDLKNGSITGKIIDENLQQTAAYASIVIKTHSQKMTITPKKVVAIYFKN